MAKSQVSEVPVGVDVQIRRLERSSCNVTCAEHLCTDVIVDDDLSPDAEDRKVSKRRPDTDRRVSHHRPDDEEIRFMDRRQSEAFNPGIEVFENVREMVTHQRLADSAILGSNRPRRRSAD